jgi:hypothetical protein
MPAGERFSLSGRKSVPRTGHEKAPGLFHETCLERGWLRNGTWADDPVERKLTREELAECYRIWVVHRDIRDGRVKAA